MPFLKMFTKTGNVDESLNLLGGKKVSPLAPNPGTNAGKRTENEALLTQNRNPNLPRQLNKETNSDGNNSHHKQNEAPELNFRPVANEFEFTKGKTKEQNQQRDNHFNLLFNARDFILNLWKPPVFESNESIRKEYENLDTHNCRFRN
ncbi:unnamed protein product [Caenorhabditis brenneri]